MSRQSTAYATDEHDAIARAEDESYWFRHRNDVLASLVMRFPPPQGASIADIGGGNGIVARRLSDEGFHCLVVEPGAAGVATAKRRGVEAICSDLEYFHPPPGKFGACGLFDVLEHVEDDVGALRRVRDILPEQGMLYLSVPAHQALYSAFDRGVGHFRRYSRSTLMQVVREAGFKVRYCSGMFAPLILPILVLRALPYRLGLTKHAGVAETAEGARNPPSPILDILKAALSGDVRAVRAGRERAIGASFVLAAQR